MPFKPKRLIFRDAEGKFVKNADRYTEKVKMVQAFRGDRYVEIIEQGGVTPRKLVDLVTREEFEALPPAYGEPREVESVAKKYKAWDLAGSAMAQRGIKGKRVKATLTFKHGTQTRTLSFFFQPKKRARLLQNQTAFWSAMVRALGLEGLSEYDKVGSRFLEDRRGTQKINLKSVTIERLL